MNRKVVALSTVLAMALSPHVAMSQTDPGLDVVSQTAGYPMRDGKLDIAAFTPRQWQVRPNHTPWEIADRSRAGITYFSYSSSPDRAQPNTNIAVKYALYGKHGGFSELTVSHGYIDCSQPGVYPQTIYRAQESRYDPDTGATLHDDAGSIDISVASTPLLGQLTAKVCDLVNGRPPKY